MHFANRWRSLAYAALVYLAGSSLASAVPVITNILTPYSSYLKAGAGIEFDLIFSEPVTVTGSPSVTVRIGSTERQFVVGFVYNGQVTFRYVTQPGDNGTLNITGPVQLNGGTIKGADGSDASLAFSPTEKSSIVFDTVTPAAPTVTGVSPASPTYQQSFTISGTAEPNTRVTLGPDSAHEAGFAYTDASGNWSANFTPHAAGSYTYQVTDVDLAGNTSTSVPVSFTVQPGAPVAGVPEIVSVTAPPNGTYNVRNHDYIYALVTFSQPVIVTGNPSMVARVGSTTVEGGASRWTSDTQVIFMFNAMVEGSLSITGPIKLNGGTIKGTDGDDAVLTFTPVDAPGVIIDKVPPAPPVVTSVTPASPTSAQSFTVSGTSEPLGSVIYQMDGGQVTSLQVDASGNWSVTLPPMTAGDHVFAADASDKAGNWAGYPSGFPTHRVITVQSATTTAGPTITSVTPPPAGTYTESSRPIAIAVNFTAPMAVTGHPSIAVRIGSADAQFIEGFSYGGNQVVFNYQPKSTDSGGLQITGPILLNGGTIKGTDGTDASLAFTPVDASNVVFQPTSTSGGPSGSTPQTITFSSPVSAVVIGQPITLGATSSAGLPITYSVLAGDATLAGNVLTPRSTAPLTVRAASVGNATYAAASTDVNFGSPQKAAQVINATTSAQAVKAGSTVTLAATSSAGLPVTYAIVSGPGTVNGNTLTLTGTTGTVLVRASQAGSDTYAAASDVTLRFDITPVPISRLVNISSRLHVSANDSGGASIAGFVVTGSSPKQILIRGVGPTLASFGVSSPLATPELRLYDNSGKVIAANAGWNGDAQIAAAALSVSAFPFTAGSKDAALLVTLAPGSYTVQLASSASGTALIEVYDMAAGTTATKQLINISTRGTVGTGDDVLIGGFVIAGDQPKRVLIRGIGPTLASFVSGSLNDAVLTVYDTKQVVIARNDNWGTAQPITPGQQVGTAAEIGAASTATGAFPLTSGSADAALLLTLNPGSYSAVVTGANNARGAAMVEVYEVPE